MKILNHKSRILNLKSGFTLIELLIVIVIIGLISTIVLSSLNASRDRGYETQITQQLVSLRSGAELYFYAQTPAGYGIAADCNSGMFINVNPNEGKPGATIDPAILPSGVERRCASTARTYAVKVSSYTQNGYWCADSKGVLKFYSGAIGDPVALCP